MSASAGSSRSSSRAGSEASASASAPPPAQKKPALGGGFAAKFKAAANAVAATAGIKEKVAKRVPGFMAATASSKNQENEEKDKVKYVDPKASAAAKAKAALLALRGIEGKQLRDVKAATAAEMAKWNEEHMKSLTLNALAAFRPAQISLLSAAQASALSNEQLAGLDAEQVAALSTEAISAMSVEQILALQPEQVAALTDAQLVALGAEHAAALSEAQLNLFNRGQLSRLPPEQQARLRGWAQARQIAAAQKATGAEAGEEPPKQAKVVALTRRQIATMPKSALSIGVVDPRNPDAGTVPLSQMLEAGMDIPVDALPPEVIATLSPSAAAAMDAASLSKLTKEQVASLVRSGAVKALSVVQLEALKSSVGFATLAAAPQEGGGKVNPDATALLAAVQEVESAAKEVKAADVKTVSKWSAAKLKAFTAAQVGSLGKAQVAAMSGAQLASLAPEALAGMDPEVLASLTADQVSQLTPEQLANLPTRVVTTLSAGALSKLTSEQLAAFAPDVIMRFDAEQIQALAKVAEKLGDGASGAPAHVKAALQEVAAGASKVAKATVAEVKQWTTTELSKFTAAQVSQLTTEQVKALTPQQLAALPSDALLALDQKVAAVLTEEQMVSLSHAAVAGITVRKMGKSAAALASVKLAVQWRKRETADEVHDESELARKAKAPMPLRTPTTTGEDALHQLNFSGHIEEEALAKAAKAVAAVDYRKARGGDGPAPGQFYGVDGEVDDEPDILVVLVDEAYPGAGGGAPIFSDVDDWAPLTASVPVRDDGEIVEVIEGPGDGRDDVPSLRLHVHASPSKDTATSFGLQSILALGTIDEEDGLDTSRHIDPAEMDAWRTPRRMEPEPYDESFDSDVDDDLGDFMPPQQAHPRAQPPPPPRAPSRATEVDDEVGDFMPPPPMEPRAQPPPRAPSRATNVDDEVDDEIVDEVIDDD
ncbi:trimeric autotransporter adhesin [Pseudoscourfieldia marina]